MEHERLSQSAKMTHELYKVGIITPCVLGVVCVIGFIIHKSLPPQRPVRSLIAKKFLAKSFIYVGRYLRNGDDRTYGNNCLFKHENDKNEPKNASSSIPTTENIPADSNVASGSKTIPINNITQRLPTVRIKMPTQKAPNSIPFS